MLIKELRAIKSSPRDIRNFAIVIGIALVLLGLWFWRRNIWDSFYTLWIVAAAIVILGYSLPQLLKPPQKAWMGLAVILGFIVGKIILTIIFFILVTPLRLISRIFGKEFLKIKKVGPLQSYWEQAAEPNNLKEYYTHQF